jgi:hypothetical protein
LNVWPIQYMNRLRGADAPGVKVPLPELSCPEQTGG